MDEAVEGEAGVRDGYTNQLQRRLYVRYTINPDGTITGVDGWLDETTDNTHDYQNDTNDSHTSSHTSGTYSNAGFTGGQWKTYHHLGLTGEDVTTYTNLNDESKEGFYNGIVEAKRAAKGNDSAFRKAMKEKIDKIVNTDPRYKDLSPEEKERIKKRLLKVALRFLNLEKHGKIPPLTHTTDELKEMAEIAEENRRSAEFAASHFQEAKPTLEAKDGNVCIFDFENKLKRIFDGLEHLGLRNDQPGPNLNNAVAFAGTAFQDMLDRNRPKPGQINEWGTKLSDFTPVGIHAQTLVDPNKLRVLRNLIDVFNAIIVVGLSDQRGSLKWRLDLHGHGGPHFQYGELRWDAFTLKPLEHKGVTPPPLTTKQLEEIRKAGLFDRLIKNTPAGTRSIIEKKLREELTKEVFEEMQKKGWRALGKKAAKEIAEEILKKSPLLILIILLSADEAYADVKERGIGYAIANQIVPVTLVNDISDAADAMFWEWVNRRAYEIQLSRLLKAGIPLKEAEQMAFEYIMDRLKQRSL